jgi:hypothetical protein
MSSSTAPDGALKEAGESRGMLAGHLALVIAAIFTGAALYVNVVEQPTRLRLGHNALLTEWKPSYKRGFASTHAAIVISDADRVEPSPMVA